jgi:hypothetical protein
LSIVRIGERMRHTPPASTAPPASDPRNGATSAARAAADDRLSPGASLVCASEELLDGSEV